MSSIFEILNLRQTLSQLLESRNNAVWEMTAFGRSNITSYI